jgi:dienelactone hydrolase
MIYDSWCSIEGDTRMLDRVSAHLLLGTFKPSLRFAITEALLLACAGAGAQQAGVAAATNSPASLAGRGAQSDGNTWTAPPGSQITVDRRSGRTSITLPVQPADGSREQALRFADWNLHPYAGSGPFAAVREEPPSLPTHTVYRPADLSKTPKLPVLLWANGGCRNTSVEFTRFLGELASHGYLVVAIGRSTIPFLVIHGSITAVAEEKDANGDPLIISDPASLIKGLDWAVSENGRKDSELYGKVDTAKVAAIGQSCGGPQAFRAARDTRITTVVALNSSFPTAASAGMVGGVDDGWTAEKLTIPAALFTGGPADSGFNGAEQCYKALASTLPVLKASLNTVGHTGAYPMPDLRWSGAVLAWFDWQLKGDRRAMTMFTGPDCVLCKDPDWWIDTRNIP